MRFSKRTWLIGGILYIVYIVYGTLLPFDFSFSLATIKDGLGNIEWIERYGHHFYSSKNVDVIANFIFFVPLGLIIFNIRYAMGYKRQPVLSIVIATVLGLMLSTSIEFLQLLIEARRTSYIDMISNTLGCLAGASTAALLPLVFTTGNLNRLRVWMGRTPGYILLIPVLLSGFLISDQLASLFSRSEKIGKAIFNWQVIFQPLWIWRLLFFYVPAGVVGAHLCRGLCRIKSVRLFFPVSFVLAGTIILLVELPKSFLLGEKIPAIDIWIGLGGLMMGLAFSEIIGNRLYGRIIRKKGIYLALLIVLTIFFSLLIIFKFSYPFQLEFEKSVFFDKFIFFLLSTYSFIPFTGILKLLVYSLQNIILFFPLGILIREYDTKKQSLWPDPALFSISVILVLLPVAIQFFNSYQLPFMYQVPTNAIGLILGYVIWDGLAGTDTGQGQETSEDRRVS